VKRGLLVAVSGAAILIAGLSGCSSDKSSSSGSSSSSSSSSAKESSSASSSPSVASGSGATKVTIDGQEKDLTGQVVCASMGGNVNIAVGEAATGIAAVVSEDGSKVTSVALGNVNGAVLAVGPGAGDATAAKDGNTWTIKGNATGADMANPMAGIVTKPFELVVVCP
jgi:ipoprotein LpqH